MRYHSCIFSDVASTSVQRHFDGMCRLGWLPVLLKPTVQGQIKEEEGLNRVCTVHSLRHFSEHSTCISIYTVNRLFWPNIAVVG